MTNPLLLDVPHQFETERLLVRAPRAGDGPALHEAVIETLDDLRKWMELGGSGAVVECLKAYARRSAVNFLARTDFPMLLWHKDGEMLVGAVGMHQTDWSLPKMEIGYWCRGAFEGKGYISEAVDGICSLPFRHLAPASGDSL